MVISFMKELRLIKSLLAELGGFDCEGACIICAKPGAYFFKGVFYTDYPSVEQNFYRTFRILRKLARALQTIALLEVEFEEINIEFSQEFASN